MKSFDSVKRPLPSEARITAAAPVSNEKRDCSPRNRYNEQPTSEEQSATLRPSTSSRLRTLAAGNTEDLTPTH